MNHRLALLPLVGAVVVSALAGPALADKQPIPAQAPAARAACGFGIVTYDWQDPQLSHRFSEVHCDTDGVDVWQYGRADIPGAPEGVWGTTLSGTYPNEAGTGLRSVAFVVTPSTYLVEIEHWYDIENGYDGGNLMLYPYGTVIGPLGGYPTSTISATSSYYAWCVDGESGWSGQSGDWRVDCFDLSAWMGQEVALELDFGSDASVTGLGWYIRRVRIGGEDTTNGVCCSADAYGCALTTQSACLQAGGIWHAEWTTCDPNPCAPLPPDPPSNLVIETVSPQQMHLGWENNAPEADLLIVERKDGPLGEWQGVTYLPGGALQWDDHGVIAGDTYYYRVRAADGASFSLYSNFVMGVPGTVPAAPTNVSATAFSPVMVHLTWIDQASDEAGFEIQRRQGEFGAWVDLYPKPPTNTQWAGIPAAPGTPYTLRIRAYNAFGKSAWTLSNSCNTPPNPGNFSANVNIYRGTQPVEDANVYRARGGPFVLVGVTNQFGTVAISDLALGDSLRAEKEMGFWHHCRDFADHPAFDDFGLHLVFDTETTDGNANYAPFAVQGIAGSYALQLNHFVYRYDLAFSTEWDIPNGGQYWNWLRAGCQSASDYLFNVTDGQAVLGRVAIWDNQVWWDEVDVQVMNSVHPNAHIDQYLDCDANSGEEHIFMSRMWGGAQPHQPGWFRTLIHESGHYVFGMRDEYINGNGEQAGFVTWRKQHPLQYPGNFGLMDTQSWIEELSSRNDYVTSFDYGCNGDDDCMKLRETAQLNRNGMSSWDQLKLKWEAMNSLVNVRIPQSGWFVNGASTSPDRNGPGSGGPLVLSDLHDSGRAQGPRIAVEQHDSGPGSRDAAIRVDGARGIVGGAEVYVASGTRTTYLGRADGEGRLAASGLCEGDQVRAYVRRPSGVMASERRFDAEPARAGSASDARWGFQNGDEFVIPLADGSRLRAREGDGRAPGVVVEARPQGAPESCTLVVSVRADEPIGGTPVVIAHIAGRIEALAVELMPGNRFQAPLPLDLDDPLFDGRGLFEISLADSADNVTVFAAPFRVAIAETGEDHQIHQGLGQFNLPGEDIHAEQLCVALSSNTVPFRDGAFLAFPVSDLLAIHLAQDDAYPGGAAVNVWHVDSLLAGLDETSLVLCRWNDSAATWQIVDGSQVSAPYNVTSGPLVSDGIYCVFATELAGDVTPPAAVADLGGVAVRGPGTAELLWTAPGDDGQAGAVQEYIVGYSPQPFAAGDWDALPKVTLTGVPAPAGGSERITVTLPVPGQVYYLALKSRDDASLLSPISNLTYTTSGSEDPNFLPGPPTEFRATDLPDDEGGAVALDWVASCDDGGGKHTVTGYTIYRNAPPSLLPQPLATVPAGLTSFADATASTSLEFVYWVGATDGAAEVMTPENRAFAADNLEVPTGDFSSDGFTGVNDLGLLADTWAIDGSDLEFDPLFDLDGDWTIQGDDFALFSAAFGSGGVPVTDPPGENGQAEVRYELVPGAGSEWRVNVSVSGATNLAGYSFRVTYPHTTLAWVAASPDSAGVVANMLNRAGGDTPLFLASESAGSPGSVLVANVIRRPSTITAPDGEGFLAHLIFQGTGAGAIQVTDIVLMDHQKRLNQRPATIAVRDEVAELRPYLYPGSPSPFNAQTVLQFRVPARQRVELKVYNVAGQLVRTLIDGEVEAGVHRVRWDATTNQSLQAGSGVYFGRFSTAGYDRARKIVLVK